MIIVQLFCFNQIVKISYSIHMGTKFVFKKKAFSQHDSERRL